MYLLPWVSYETSPDDHSVNAPVDIPGIPSGTTSGILAEYLPKISSVVHSGIPLAVFSGVPPAVFFFWISLGKPSNWLLNDPSYLQCVVMNSGAYGNAFQTASRTNKISIAQLPSGVSHEVYSEILPEVPFVISLGVPSKIPPVVPHMVPWIIRSAFKPKLKCHLTLCPIDVFQPCDPEPLR